MFELTYICCSLIDGGPFGGSCQIHGPASHATVGSLLSGDSEEVINIHEFNCDKWLIYQQTVFWNTLTNSQ